MTSRPLSRRMFLGALGCGGCALLLKASGCTIAEVYNTGGGSLTFDLAEQRRREAPLLEQPSKDVPAVAMRGCEVEGQLFLQPPTQRHERRPQRRRVDGRRAPAAFIAVKPPFDRETA